MLTVMDYDCTHPVTVGEYKPVTHLPNGGIVAGGLTDSYATFCEAVDMHRVSIGMKSEFIIQGTARIIQERNQLPSAE